MRSSCKLKLCLAQYCAIPTYGCRLVSGLAASQGQPQRYSFAKLLTNLSRTGTIAAPSAHQAQWLETKGYSLQDLKVWQQLLQEPLLDSILARSTSRLPAYVLLKLIDKLGYSRELYLDFLDLWRASQGHLDDASIFHGVRKLVYQALCIDPSLLHALQTELEGLPSSTTTFMFNRLLRIIASKLRKHEAVGESQSILQREMERRGVLLTKEGLEALIAGQERVQSQAEMVKQMQSRGYDLTKAYLEKDAVPTLGPRLRGKHMHLKLLPRLAYAEDVTTAYEYISESKADLRDQRIWATLLSNRAITDDIRPILIQLIRNRDISLTSFMASLFLRTSRTTRQLHEICVLALENNVQFTSAVWEAYLHRSMSCGRWKAAIDVLVNEPGGNSILDMDAQVRRNPRVWCVAIQSLNRSRTAGVVHSQVYVREIGNMYSAIRRFGIPMSIPLFENMIAAALLSGQRRWQKKHACDAVMEVFRALTQQMQQIKKFRLPTAVLESYMLLLVANEEVLQSIELMTLMLQHELKPRPRLMKTFALGLWESGQLDLVNKWQLYIEADVGLRWPAAEEIFQHKSSLDQSELKYFHGN